MPSPVSKPRRLLIVLPSWVGDAVMATPALRRIRDALPGSFIGGLCRPGIDELLAGSNLVDELHVERGGGVFGPKLMAAKVRPRQYDAALLLTNSFATAMVTRIAGIPRRIGYNRDGRGLLLTDKLDAPKRADGAWAIIPACQYYWDAAGFLIDGRQTVHDTKDNQPIALALGAGAVMELGITDGQRTTAEVILKRVGLAGAERYAMLNPGGNNPAKRWPPERFAALADHLAANHTLRILVNGSPAEEALVAQIVGMCKKAEPVSLPRSGITLGALKELIRRAALLVTNDTGPRHIAAALGTPMVSLFGPTDHRWSLVPTRAGAPEVIVLADPTLPDDLSANDHTERCAIGRIEFATVRAAADAVLMAARR